MKKVKSCGERPFETTRFVSLPPSHNYRTMTKDMFVDDCTGFDRMQRVAIRRLTAIDTRSTFDILARRGVGPLPYDK